MGKHRNSSPRENTVDYEVGYKKPPRHTQFKKGRSGNKGGRPKRNLDLKATATKVFGESVSVRVDGKLKKVPSLEAAMMNVRAGALKGDHKSMRLMVMIMDRADMIRLPEEPETEELSNEERAMLEEHLAAMIEYQPAEAGKHE